MKKNKKIEIYDIVFPIEKLEEVFSKIFKEDEKDFHIKKYKEALIKDTRSIITSTIKNKTK